MIHIIQLNSENYKNVESAFSHIKVDIGDSQVLHIKQDIFLNTLMFLCKSNSMSIVGRILKTINNQQIIQIEQL